MRAPFGNPGSTKALLLSVFARVLLTRIALIVLAVTLVMLAGLFVWQASVSAEPPSGPEASNPNAPLATPQPLSSYQRIQNLDPVAVSTITVTVYTSAGAVQGTAVTSTNPFYSALVDERSCCSVGSGFAGSGVVNATTDIGAVTYLVSGGAGTSNFRSDAYLAVPGPGVYAGPQTIPIVQKSVAFRGQTFTTTLAVQNAGASAADVYVTFFARDNSCGALPAGSSRTFTRTSVPGNATTYVNFASTGQVDLDGCTTLFGAGVVTGTQPLAIVATQSADRILAAHTGFIPTTGPSPVDAGTRVVIPAAQKFQLFNGLYFSNGISVVTADASTQPVTLTLVAESATGTCGAGTVIVLKKTANPAAGFNLSNSGVISCTSFFGSAQVDAPVPVVVVFNTNSAPDTTNTSVFGYSQAKGFPVGSGSTSIYVPSMVKNRMYPAADGVVWTSSSLGVSANMPSGSVFSGLVYCDIYLDPPIGPAVVQFTRPIANTAPRTNCSVNNPAMNAYSSFSGSLYVTSTNSILVVGTENQNYISGTVNIGDGNINYGAINR